MENQNMCTDRNCRTPNLREGVDYKHMSMAQVGVTSGTFYSLYDVFSGVVLNQSLAHVASREL